MASKVTGKQTPAKKSHRSARGAPQRLSSRDRAAQRIREVQSPVVDVGFLGQVQIPRPEELAYYIGIAVMAAAEIIDWPIALVLGVGHALSSRHNNRVVQELGEALDEGRAAQRVGEAVKEAGLAEEVLEALPEPPV